MFRRKKKQQQKEDDFDKKNLSVRLKKAKKNKIHLITNSIRLIKFRILSTRPLKSLLFIFPPPQMTKP